MLNRLVSEANLRIPGSHRRPFTVATSYMKRKGNARCESDLHFACKRQNKSVALQKGKAEQ